MKAQATKNVTLGKFLAALFLASAMSLGSSIFLSSPTQAAEVNIPDPALRACVNKQLKQDPDAAITEEQALTLEGIVCDRNSVPQVKNLQGLEYFKNIETLYILNNQILDISPVATLNNLVLLYLDGSPLSDIRPLSNMKNLEGISLNFTEVEDLTPISTLGSLSYLLASKTKVTDISPLKKLSYIGQLWLSFNKIEDFSPLASLTGLHALSLSETGFSDLSVLKNLTRMSQLDLESNGIRDISALAGMPDLQNVYLENNEIQDISALANKNKLSTLILNNNQILDISPLGTLPPPSDFRRIEVMDQKIFSPRIPVNVEQKNPIIDAFGDPARVAPSTSPINIKNSGASWSYPQAQQNKLSWSDRDWGNPTRIGTIKFNGTITQESYIPEEVKPIPPVPEPTPPAPAPTPTDPPDNSQDSSSSTAPSKSDGSSNLPSKGTGGSAATKLQLSSGNIAAPGYQTGLGPVRDGLALTGTGVKFLILAAAGFLALGGVFILTALRAKQRTAEQ